MNIADKQKSSSRSIRTLKYIFSGIVLLMILISVLTYNSFQDYNEEVGWRNHSDKVIRRLQEIKVDVLNAETGHRGYQLTRNPEYLEPYRKARRTIDLKIDQIDKLVLNETDQQNRLDTLEVLIDKQFGIINEIIAEVNKDDNINKAFSDYEINLLAFGKQNMDQIRQVIERLMDAEDKILSDRVDNVASQRQVVPVFFVISNLIAFVIIIYIFFATYRLLRSKMLTEDELKIKQLQLMEAERMSNIGHWKWDQEQDEVSWSDGLYNIYNLNPKSYHPNNKSFEKYIHPEDRKLVTSTIAGAMEKNEPYEIGFRLLFHKENIKHVYSIGRPQKNSEGEFVAYFGVTKDITTQKKYEDQIIQTSEELKRSNQDLEQFAYVASHDLQEPLRKIRAFGDRLQTKYSEGLGDTGTDYIERMQNAAERMQGLINDLLTFSRVSRKDQEFFECDLTSILEETIDLLESRISDTKGKIEYDQLPSIKCNELEIKRLLQNIIGNALKFHKEGESPYVKVSADVLNASDIDEDVPVEGHRKYVRLSIKDNGIGFSEKYKERIFNIFQRLHGRSQYKGTGIGLAICRKIVVNHEGFIFAEGEENKGAEFIIILPVNLKKSKDHEQRKELASNING